MLLFHNSCRSAGAGDGRLSEADLANPVSIGFVESALLFFDGISRSLRMITHLWASSELLRWMKDMGTCFEHGDRRSNSSADLSTPTGTLPIAPADS